MTLTGSSLVGLVPQTQFGAVAGSRWNPGSDLVGYTPPVRSVPALAPERLRAVPFRSPHVVVLGTVRDEFEAWGRSWAVWKRQRLPADLRVRYLVLDDGSSDGTALRSAVRAERADGHRVEYVRARPPGAKERCCTLAFNEALRREDVAGACLVVVQWWDRIPGSHLLLARLLAPHRQHSGIATSAVARHVGGSSSEEVLDPVQLAARLALVPWEREPESLVRVAGPIGAHCRPGAATESACLCLPPPELASVGGWDERYRTRASWANVDLFRRLLATGLVCWFLPPDAPGSGVYHQSHACPDGRRKDDPVGLKALADPRVLRNGGPCGAWGGRPAADTPPEGAAR